MATSRLRYSTMEFSDDWLGLGLWKVGRCRPAVYISNVPPVLLAFSEHQSGRRAGTGQLTDAGAQWPTSTR